MGAATAGTCRKTDMIAAAKKPMGRLILHERIISHVHTRACFWEVFSPKTPGPTKSIRKDTTEQWPHDARTTESDAQHTHVSRTILWFRTECDDDEGPGHDTPATCTCDDPTHDQHRARTCRCADDIAQLENADYQEKGWLQREMFILFLSQIRSHGTVRVGVWYKEGERGSEGKVPSHRFSPSRLEGSIRDTVSTSIPTHILDRAKVISDSWYCS